MSTESPKRVATTEAAEAWWDGLTDQERIIAALAVEPPDPPCDVAENPWKWLQEAYELAQDNAR